MADWYVYQHDGGPLGPWSTDTVADAILAGKLAPDVWVAAPGGPRWLRALDVPVIGRLVDGLPTKPRRDSGLRIMPQAYRDQPSTASLSDSHAARGEDESGRAASSAPATIRTPDDTLQIHVPTRTIETREDAIAFAADSSDDDPPTDPAMPPSSDPSTPQPPQAHVAREQVLGAPLAERRRSRKNG